MSLVDTIKRFFLIGTLFWLLGLAGPAGAVDIYELSGSDLGLGVGTRAVGMAGAFTSIADGPEALYFNVAGLARVERTQLSLMVDYPFHITFAGLAIKTPWHLFGRPLSIGVGVTSRMRLRMEGDFSLNERARDITRLSLIYIPTTFNGGVESTTYDYQVALALPATDQLDVGLSGSRVDCLTTFFGRENGRICQSSAFWQVNGGLLYRPADGWQLGLHWRNIFDGSKPKFVKFGAARWWAPGLVSALEGEYIFGKRLLSNALNPNDPGLGPGSPVTGLLLRAGAEAVLDPGLVLRGGLFIPLILDAGGLGDLGSKVSLARIGPTLGLTYRADRFSFDAAVVPDIGRTYVTGKIHLGTNATLTVVF